MPRPAALEELARALARLPGIGAVTSERLAYHLLSVPRQEALAMAAAIKRALDEICVCTTCGNFDQEDPCWVCRDPERDRGMILVVESPRDVVAFETAGHRGVYHVLHGRLAPLEGIAEGDLAVAGLVARAVEADAVEVCIATSPDLEGEATSRLIAERLASTGARVTRIARGIPAGAAITQVQGTILSDALEGRRPVA